jgi:hypothetical protein
LSGIGATISNSEFRNATLQAIERIGSWPAATERSDIGLSVNSSRNVARTEAAAIFAGIMEVQPIIAAHEDVDCKKVFAVVFLSNLIGQIPAPIKDANFKQ